MTTINIGDPLNLTGATAIPNFAPAGAFRAGYTGSVTQPVDLRSNPMGKWTQGLYSGAWATYKTADAGNTSSGAYPQFSWLGGYASAFPNADACTDLSIEPVSISGGMVTMQPTLMTAATKAAIQEMVITNAANGFTAADAATVGWVAGAINSAPFCLQPPLAFGFNCTLPADMAKGGRWPAGWLLPSPQAWPPEDDFFEAVTVGGVIQLTSSVHDTVLANGSTTTIWGTGAPSQTVAIMGVVYPDLTAVFNNGVCVAKFPTESDMAATFWYLILDDGIGAAGSWAGGVPPGTTKLAPTVFSDITAYAMPAVYAGPSVTPWQTLQSSINAALEAYATAEGLPAPI